MTLQSPVEELQRRLKEAQLSNEASLPRVVRSMGLWFALPETSQAFLDYAGLDRAYLETVAEQSYVHDNGFAKLILSPEATGNLRVRLHSWSPTRDRDEQNVHSHCFNLVSHVLLGELTDVQWIPSASTGRPFRHYRYMTKLGGDSYRLELVSSEARLTEGPTNTYRRGATYELDRRALHQTRVPPHQETLTLFVEDRRQGLLEADVYSTKDIPESGEMASPQLTTEEYLSKLAQALSPLLAPLGD